MPPQLLEAGFDIVVPLRRVGAEMHVVSAGNQRVIDFFGRRDGADETGAGIIDARAGGIDHVLTHVSTDISPVAQNRVVRQIIE